MTGDFSRDTFNRQHRFARVLMQQGRVLLDADWNEQTSILLHYLRTLAADIIGPRGGPGDGFKIVCDDAYPCDFVIAWGHYYVDGILCENEPLRRCPPGAEVRPLRYTSQPDYPLKKEDEARLEKDTPYLVYLDVWERHLTHVEEAHIREVALGGADTATRARVVCQVKVATKPKDAPADVSCAEWLRRVTAEGPRCLRARARVAAPSEDPCIIPPEARYRGAENQLYRVEIHDGGSAAAANCGATFKWSRDNGSVVMAIQTLQGAIATLDSLGPDARRGLAEGASVEIVDDDSALRFAPRPLVKVEAVDPVRFQATLGVPEGVELPVFDEHATTHPMLRRWDQDGGALPVREGKWIDLEDGVQIYFEPGGAYRTGDYWLIPARRATGDVIWPAESGADGDRPAALPPHGIDHHVAPLARISVDGTGTVSCEADCRCTFDPICGPAAQAPAEAPAIDSLTATPPVTDTCAGSRVSFSAAVRGDAPLRFSWDFGDGTRSTAVTPSHHYSREGAFTVGLSVSNAAGEAVRTLDVRVTPCARDEPAAVFFPLNGSALAEAQIQVLERNLGIVRAAFAGNATARATIVGVAAREETRPAELATARAVAVQKYYLDKGIEPNRLATGEPVIDADPNVPAAQKRRVDTRVSRLSGPSNGENRLAILRRIDGVGEKRAELLLAAGHDTPAAVAALSADEIRRLLGVSESAAEEILASARKVAEETR